MQELQWCMSQGYTNQQAADHLGINERTVRRWKERLKPESHKESANDDGSMLGGYKTFVITSAVNATKTHAGFLKSLRVYCDENNAQLLVIPLRYRNPTRKEETTDDWWCPSITPDLLRERTRIANGLVALADIKIQPTAVNPLQGWLTVSGSDSAILGHTKIALKSVPTHVGEPAKLVMTTGACTVEQYSDTNAGARGSFHHTMGAVVVEIDGKSNYIRHICPVKDGSFIDLDTRYTPKGVEVAPSAEVLTMGDTHAELADKRVLDATSELAIRIKPRAIVQHDVLNFGSAGHHNRYFEKFRRYVTNTSSVLRELETTAKVLDRISTWAPKVVMVSSNHHDHFGQWLEKAEHAHDLENAIVYHETKSAMLRAIHEGGNCDPFRYWMDRMMTNSATVHWLKHGESFKKHGIEFGWHGHAGPNGARGSTKGFANMGAKVTKGHSHGAEIIDGAHSVGLSGKMDMGYNVGSPSGWTHTHDITYANGKRTLIHCVNGRFFR